MDTDAIIEFTFTILDVKKHHHITRDALLHLIEINYGQKNADVRLDRLITKLLTHPEDNIIKADTQYYSLPQFKTTIKYAPDLIQRALQLQVCGCTVCIYTYQEF
jgi:hypothetical protein